MRGRGWTILIGLSTAVQFAAGVAFYLQTPLRDAAPFGLVLCVGIGVLSVTALRFRRLSRVAITGNLLLAGLTALGVIPVVIGLATEAAEPSLAWNAVVGAVLSGASAANAVGL